jgi:hypothetical protein
MVGPNMQKGVYLDPVPAALFLVRPSLGSVGLPASGWLPPLDRRHLSPSPTLLLVLALVFRAQVPSVGSPRPFSP